MLERNKKKLHRVASNHGSDWDGLSKAEMNSWQQVASATKGIVTLGNILTLAGFFLVITGLGYIADQRFILGTLVIGAGRMLDYFDGITADMTRTKSRLGASFDEVADALGLGILLIVLLIQNVLPLILVLIIGLPKAVNALSWIIAKLRRIRADTTAQSKVATFIIWCGIGTYLLHIPISSRIHYLFQISGWMLATFGAALTAPSSAFYIRKSLAKKN